VRSASRFPNGVFFVLILSISLCLAGCGGGGGAASSDLTTEPATPRILSWDPPQSFADQTPLDPATDLKEYLVYVNETGIFSASDPSSAVVSAVDPATGEPVKSFDLANLSAFLSPNVTYYICMQSVSVTGVKSDFSPVAAFAN
jgi:hypothetical protein